MNLTELFDALLRIVVGVHVQWNCTLVRQVHVDDHLDFSFSRRLYFHAILIVDGHFLIDCVHFAGSHEVRLIDISVHDRLGYA